MRTRQARRMAALLLAGAALMAGCGSGQDDATLARGTESTAPDPTTTTSPLIVPEAAGAAPVPSTTSPPTTVPGPPTGRPVAATDPAGLAEQIMLAERLIRDPTTSADQMTAAARLQQVVYRQLGRHPEWDAEVLARIPSELVEVVQLHSDARRQFAGLLSRVPDTMPVWEIVAPETAENLLSYYREAEATFGVSWPYLAAINLVETGMGRIRGLSTAGAQGPMQFMPATWAAYGEGDINAPRDAILAAGRYLAANGFAGGDVDHALFRYNNHPNYVAGVRDYARIIELDPQAFYGLYHWEVYYASVAGDLWLPVGYALPEQVPVVDWVASHPQS